jgi:hypothetical protein
MTLGSKLALTVCALILLGGAYATWQDRQRAIGRLEAQLVTVTAEKKLLLARADSLARAYRIDTVRLTKFKPVFDTLKIDVDRWKYDTVKVTEFVALADSTVKACSAALSTCEARVGAISGALAASETANQALRRLLPPPSAAWRHRAAGAIAGVALYALLDKLVP